MRDPDLQSESPGAMIKELNLCGYTFMGDQRGIAEALGEIQRWVPRDAQLPVYTASELLRSEDAFVD